jgi:hypothetical protein
VERTRHEEPSYFRALLAAGLIDEKSSKDIAWSVWESLCRDKTIIRKSQELQKLEKVFLPSVAAPFKNGAQVLAAMSERQISAMKKRLGIPCPAR